MEETYLEHQLQDTNQNIVSWAFETLNVTSASLYIKFYVSGIFFYPVCAAGLMLHDYESPSLAS